MEEILIDGRVQPEFVGHAREIGVSDVYMPEPFTGESPIPVELPPLRTIIYAKRPLRTDLTDTTLTFIEIMNTVMASLRGSWSFVGGFARDTYLGTPYNDYDVCVPSIPMVQESLMTMGVLDITQAVDMEIPHDYYIDPYDFQKRQIPVHWIAPMSETAYAPDHFDFSINQICLKTDGFFHAPTQTWRDLDRGIIRRTGLHASANIAIRAIRFASRYGFTIEDELDKEITEFAKGPLDTVMLKRNLHKMVDDGVGEQALGLLQHYGFARTDECETIEEYIAIQDQLIVAGLGYREPAPRERFYF